MLNKSEFVNKHAETYGMTKKEAEQAIAQVFETLSDAMIEDGGVKVVGFGKFEVLERAARVGRNPQTNTEIKIPAQKYAKFTSKSIKEALNAKA